MVRLCRPLGASALRQDNEALRTANACTVVTGGTCSARGRQEGIEIVGEQMPFATTEIRSGGIALAGGFCTRVGKVTGGRRPSFPYISDMVPGLFKDIWIDLEFARQSPSEIGRGLKLPDVPAGENG